MGGDGLLEVKQQPVAESRGCGLSWLSLLEDVPSRNSPTPAERGQPSGPTERTQPAGAAERTRPSGPTDRTQPAGAAERTQGAGPTERAQPVRGDGTQPQQRSEEH